MSFRIRFGRFFDRAPAITPADPSLFGSIPLRARQHCMPFTEVNAWGYHVFPPINFKIMWDGRQIYWRYGDLKGWLPLVQAHLPHQYDLHQQRAPEGAKRFSPIFLESFPEPGIIQIWSGYVAQTAPDWSLWIRSPVNLPPSPFYDVVEAIVETDWWLGPLVTNLRITKTHAPIEFRTGSPLFQIVPVPRSAYEATRRGGDMATVDPYADWSAEEWSHFQRIFEIRNSGSPGEYARTSRKRPPAGVVGCPREAE